MKSFVIPTSRRNLFRRTSISNAIESKIWNYCGGGRLLGYYCQKEFSIMSKDLDNVYLLLYSRR